MYDITHTANDVLRERYILGSELVGRYGMPKLKRISADVSGLKSVPFTEARKEKNPKKSVVHCFLDDCKFETLWREPMKSIETLFHFRYVIPPDFSFYSDMPLALQIYQVYRMRAIHNFITESGISCIPVAGWAGEESFEFCFDGLPENSTVAVSTNGCFSKEGMECYRRGFSEMCRRLHPARVIVVGKPISVNEDVEMQYLDSFGQQMVKRMEECNG